LHDWVLELPMQMVFDMLDYNNELQAFIDKGIEPAKTAKNLTDLKSMARRLNK